MIAAGLLYGHGENLLNFHFRSAWLEDPKSLPYIGEGNNIIPTIHVKDLASLVERIIETRPERHYIFGIDNTEKAQAT